MKEKIQDINYFIKTKHTYEEELKQLHDNYIKEKAEATKKLRENYEQDRKRLKLMISRLNSLINDNAVVALESEVLSGEKLPIDENLSGYKVLTWEELTKEVENW